LLFIITVELILLCFPGPSETVRGSNFYFSRLFYHSVYPLSLCPKKGGVIFLWTGNVFPNWSSDFLSQNGQMASLLVFWPYSVFG